MPWKTITMTETKRAFVQKALAAGANLSALCREFNVTRKTGRSGGIVPARVDWMR